MKSYSFNPQWAHSVALFEQGEFNVYTLQEGDDSVYFQYIKRDIANELSFLEKGVWFDIVTPFDYGGIFYSNEQILEKFLVLFEEKCYQENIISGFFRFNPLLTHPYALLKNYIDIINVQEHIFIPLETDYHQMYSKRKLRNIKKAKRYNYTFIENDTIDNFYSIYAESMNRVHSSEYFLFSPEILKQLLPFGKVMSIHYENRVVSSLFMIEEEEIVYYFLGGTSSAYLDYGFNSLLFDLVCDYYKATKKIFFLGGGKGGLYQYKKEFSHHTVPFYIGKKIFNQDKYQELVTRSHREGNDFFPAYRKKVI